MKKTIIILIVLAVALIFFGQFFFGQLFPAQTVPSSIGINTQE